MGKTLLKLLLLLLLLVLTCVMIAVRENRKVRLVGTWNDVTPISCHASHGTDNNNNGNRESSNNIAHSVVEYE